MVVYAAATDVSVGRMFLGGVLPGLVAGGMLMIGIYIAARRQNLPAQPWRGFGEVWRAARDAMWGLLLVVIVLGGIYGGVFTPTEAAAVVAVYSFLIVNFMYRDLGPLRGVAWRREGEAAAAAAWRGLRDTARGLALAAAHPDNRRVLVESSRTTVMLMFIIANALLFAHVSNDRTSAANGDEFYDRRRIRMVEFFNRGQFAFAFGRAVYGAVGACFSSWRRWCFRWRWNWESIRFIWES